MTRPDYLYPIPAAQRQAAAARLPRMTPVDGSWITVDGAYAAQIAEKQRILDRHRPEVIAALPGAAPLCAEARDEVLRDLAAHPGFEVEADHVRCPDGRVVALCGAPFEVLSQIIQEDLCILEKRGAEHVLVAALLAFPSSWTLSQKLGRAMLRIHRPVESYDAGIAARVQRLFDGIQVGRPLWRANLLKYQDPDLYQPRREYQAKGRERECPDRYWRSERQTMLRLPQSGAVLFAIHTTVEAV